MTKYQIPYGRGVLEFALPIPADTMTPLNIEPYNDPLSAVVTAIEHPIDGVRIEDFLWAKSVALVINDKTRPAPNHLFLPPLIAKLESVGISPENICLWIATGTHTPVTREEHNQIVPKEVLDKVRVRSHDCDDLDNLEYLGKTYRGTPVWINKSFLMADIRIVTGEIEPHHFMGFSGGVKSACIGLAGRQTINHNHAMLTDPLASLGEYDRNPMRQDVEEMGDMVHVHFALNAILTAEKKMMNVLFGSPKAVMKAGTQISRNVSQIQIEELYDLVIASPGGHPKDINLYQSQKAISHAAQFCRKGGAIIVAAACPEGSGSQDFENFMAGVTSFDQVFEKFSEQGFQIGPHKAFQLARQAEEYRIYFVSLMPHQTLNQFLLLPVDSIEDGLQKALLHFPKVPRVAILPFATNSIPYIAPASMEGQ